MARIVRRKWRAVDWVFATPRGQKGTWSSGLWKKTCEKPFEIDECVVGTHRADRRGVVRSVLVDQAAQMLGVSRRTVYYRIREGRLQTLRTRCGSQRVLVESIEALMR